MGLDFSKAAVQQPVVSAVPDTKEEIAVVEQYDIVADREGIYISKHVPACFHCGSVDDVKTILGLEVCLGCAEKIREVFENGGE